MAGYSRTLEGKCPDCMRHAEFSLVRAVRLADPEDPETTRYSFTDAWQCSNCGHLVDAMSVEQVQERKFKVDE